MGGTFARALISLLLLPAVANAQSLVPPDPAQSTEPEAVVLATIEPAQPELQQPYELQQPAVKPSIGSSSEPDFFVLDTSNCPQKPGHHPAYCHGRVSRYLGDRRYHSSSAAELQAALQPGVPICIVVHGSFVGSGSLYPETVGRYTRMIAAANDRPLHFIGSHWPSRIAVPILPPVQARCLGRRAEFNGIYLAQFINTLPPENPICLMGHSHGCRVIASAMHLLGGGTVRGYVVRDTCPGRRIRAVFGAGAIDHHWLNPREKYGCALNRLDCLLNIMNPSDLVLKVYPLQDLFLHQAAGRLGFYRSDIQRIGGNARKIRQLDVSRLVGGGHTIKHYAPWPQIRQAFLPYVYSD